MRCTARASTVESPLRDCSDLPLSASRQWHCTQPKSMVTMHLLCPVHPPLLSHKRTVDTLQSTKWHRVTNFLISVASNNNLASTFMSGANTNPGHVTFGRSAPLFASTISSNAAATTTRRLCPAAGRLASAQHAATPACPRAPTFQRPTSQLYTAGIPATAAATILGSATARASTAGLA